MTVEGKDYKLTPIGDASIFFDLELLATIAPKGKESREEWKTSGYGLRLDHAILIIAHYRLTKNHKDEAISIKQYVSEYRDIIKTLKTECGLAV